LYSFTKILPHAKAHFIKNKTILPENKTVVCNPKEAAQTTPVVYQTIA